MSKILVLGTGPAQADLIRTCKAKGWDVYAVSYRSGYIGEQFADHFDEINIVDEDAIKEYAQNNSIDYIYSTGSDIAMPTAFEVSEKLGLRAFCKPQTAVICNNKHLLRTELGNDFEGNVPFQCLTGKNQEIKIPYPFMIKPDDSQGQRGVFKVKDHDEYLSRFDESISFSRSKKIVIEQFISGEEFSVNTFSVNGKIVFSLISGRESWAEHSGGLIHKHYIPVQWKDDSELTDRVNSLVSRTLARLEINNGPAYFQIKITEDRKPYIIEVTPRLDGCHMWRLIKYSTGIDLMELTVNAIENKEIPENFSYNILPYETEFMCSAPGIAFSKADFELGNYEFLEWYYQDGDIVRRMNGYKEKCGYVIRRLS
ncbi:MAG: ATP-grasp domain-containing protein [Clostridiales bacterium]|nr:ATP-grasp domain-containing protein [Clostridiales bacterium]